MDRAKQELHYLYKKFVEKKTIQHFIGILIQQKHLS